MSAISQWAQGIDLQWLRQELFIIIAALSAITVHETCHGLVAHWLGDDTAKRQGRLSLNPLRHIDIVGLVMMAVLHFGWAKPVQVDPRRFKNPKAGMALTALAGPVSNVLLALLAMLICRVALACASITQSQALVYIGELFYCVLIINTGLAVFNIIPIPPLDGSKILAMFLPQKAHSWLMRYERYGMLLLVALLFFQVLDTPLIFLREGLISGLEIITRKPCEWIVGLIF